MVARKAKKKRSPEEKGDLVLGLAKRIKLKDASSNLY